MKQNPFSFYDFLGYMIPGAVFLYLTILIFRESDFLSTFHINDMSNSSNQLVNFIPAVICAYLTGHVLAVGSSAVIESFSKRTNGYPSTFLFAVKPDFYIEKDFFIKTMGWFVLWIIILPISFLQIVLKDILKIEIFNQAKSLPDELRKVTFKKCTKILESEIGVDISKMKLEKGIDGDYLRLLYHFVFENSERHSGKLQNYVALYGLTRNVSFVFVLVFWGAASSMFKGDIPFNPQLLFFLSLLSYVFYIGFVKFYRRYSLEVIMAASIFKHKND